MHKLIQKDQGCLIKTCKKKSQINKIQSDANAIYKTKINSIKATLGTSSLQTARFE